MKRIIKIGIIVLAVAAIFLAYGYLETYLLGVTPSVIVSKDLPPEFAGKIVVFAADFHCGIFFGPGRVKSVVAKINALNPDIVILGGDYVDSEKNFIKPCIAPLAGLRAAKGVFAVLGNRDYVVGAQAVKDSLAGAGVAVLENNYTAVTINNQRIRIAGVADFLQGKAGIAAAMANARSDDFVILVSHNPTYVERISTQDIDLVLSGHTHGGQVTLFGFWSPLFNFKYGHKYVLGPYQKGDTQILVTSGVGTRLLPIRFFARPEINLITLEQAK